MDRAKQRQILIEHEGWRNKRYRCTKGHDTIGVGWNMETHKFPADIESYYRINKCITDEMIERLLVISTDTAIQDCREIFKGFDNFTENRQMALVDFLFNLGAGRALGFKKARAAIKEGDWNKAADEFKDSDWFRQVQPSRSEWVVRQIREG